MIPWPTVAAALQEGCEGLSLLYDVALFAWPRTRGAIRAAISAGFVSAAICLSVVGAYVCYLRVRLQQIPNSSTWKQLASALRRSTGVQVLRVAVGLADQS
jgi:hypothetical protein